MQINEANYLFTELYDNPKNDRYDVAGPRGVIGACIRDFAIIKDPQGQHCSAIFFNDGSSIVVRELPNTWITKVIKNLTHLADLFGDKPKTNSQAQHVSCRAYQPAASPECPAFDGPPLATNHGKKLP